MITQEMVKSLFKYRDGDLIRIKKTNNRVKVGDIAGNLMPSGYIQTQINGKRYYNHRLIYLYHNGCLPEYLDHVDNDPTNNKIENLRPCSRSNNSHNSKIRKNNKSGIKGVCWHKEDKRWRAQIVLNNKNIYIGNFENLNDAKLAVEDKRLELHKEFANHG